MAIKMVPSRFTKVKIAVGYTLLLAVLLFSLFFVRREMETLSASDNQQSLQSDSLLLLLREKDQNTIRMLRILSEANDRSFTPVEVEEIIAEQDSVIVQQRVQHRVITRRDSLITKPRKKGFFKRFAEVFVPSKQDSAVLLNTSLEFATDTILEPYSVVDSLHQRLRTVSQQKQKQVRQKPARQSNVQYHRRDKVLTARIDSLVKGYELEVIHRAHQDAEKGKEIRQRSTRILGSIAIGAVLLSAFFLILILRDITRSNRYRRQIEEANRRAEELLEAREKLMLAITHDFKAPLGSIIGYTDLLADLTPNQRQRFYLDNMKSSSAHLLRLVNDLLDFHRLDLQKAEINRVAFHPAHLFDEICVSFEPLTAAKGLVFHRHIAPELDGRFISDPLRIRQVVTNLLSNAVKFTARGEVALTVSYADSRLRIDVTDTGKGMASTDCERIFQEFTRLPGAQGEEGFGLGLSIVRKLVLLLEGTIEVQSTPGEGSTFTVTLPLFPIGEAVSRSSRVDRPKELLPSDEHLQYLSRQNIRLLLIDDDRIQLTLTAAMLAQQGLTAVCCEQLEELIEHLRTDTFDLLLTDVQMPAINGFDLLKLLRASNIPQARTLPVVAVTARSDMKPQEFITHGFAGCLHKPFTVAELLAMVSRERPVGAGTEGSLAPNGEPRLATNGQQSAMNFAALTAFSEGDAQAAQSIIRTFIEETQKNAARMQDALVGSDVNGVAAMAHKLLPLFTLIDVSGALPLLTWLEALRGEEPSEEWRQKSREVLNAVEETVEEAKRYEMELL